MQSSNLNAISFLFVFNLKMFISKFYQGYVRENPKTDDFIDDNSRISFGHRLIVILDEIYEVRHVSSCYLLIVGFFFLESIVFPCIARVSD